MHPHSPTVSRIDAHSLSRFTNSTPPRLRLWPLIADRSSSGRPSTGPPQLSDSAFRGFIIRSTKKFK
ncbi:hypothetical protein L6452_12970 [Arctium lappa]|uniref:Uncharacterized protein n=1 Tax=Arctium lappa TaxID=4217 RepID=A0ACB9CHB4_ARCLA|nr:hypothetical protein L6452_12970 [Arctium lappa]